MAEKKFYLESEKPLQEIGMRAQVISFLISRGVIEGNAINDPKSSKKVIVVIRAEDENKIKEIKSELVKYLNKLRKNDFCYSKFPQDIKASDLLELNNPRHISLINLNILANSLMLEQTSKGVGAMKYLAEANLLMLEQTSKGFGAMKDLAETLKPLEKLPEILKELSNKLNKLG